MKKLAHTHLVKLHEMIDSPADDKMFLVLDLIRGDRSWTGTTRASATVPRARRRVSWGAPPRALACETSSPRSTIVS